MTKATSWTEKVAYIECPDCGETEELGSGIIWGNDKTWMCNKCKKSFEVDDRTDKECRW